MLHNIFIIKVVWHHGETQSVAKLGIPKKSYLIKQNVISATILQYFFYSELFRRTINMSIISSELIRVQAFFDFDCLIFLNKSRVQIELTDKKRRGNGKRATKMVQKNWDEWISGLDIKRTIQGEENERLRRWRVIITLWGFYWLNFNTMSVIVHAFPLLHFFQVLISF